MKLIEQTMHENNRSDPRSDPQVVRMQVHNHLVVRLVKHSTIARTIEETYAKVIAKYTDTNIDRAAHAVGVFVMHRSHAHTHDAFWKQPRPETRDCNICFESIEPQHQVLTECNHVYCTLCMHSYLESFDEKEMRAHCAVCRKNMVAVFQ